jgi:hypothetical protein
MSDRITVRNYAIRRVNPFRGVMQIIETEEGRALSCNGIVWEILVRASQDSTLSSPAGDNNKKTYYRFGLWSKDDGLIKRSNSPVDEEDYFQLVSKCETLVEHVRQHLPRLPFELQDDLELWLLDKDSRRPFALLSTLAQSARFPSQEPRYWSACIGANGSPGLRRFPESRDLEAQVSQRAGFNITKQWVKRLPGGDGIVQANESTIPADQFPVLLLDENWNNEEDQQRAREYIRWISPSLLTLQHLDTDIRARLENNLNVQAISVEHHWQLYPEILDHKLLKAARVQNRIEQASR